MNKINCDQDIWYVDSTLSLQRVGQFCWSRS